jgi:tetratricopeptide (TPR) repeat protein
MTTRWITVLLGALALATAQAAPSRAQVQAPSREKAKAGPTDPRADRRKALELSEEHRDLEALPMLEALAKADPNDRAVGERLAVALVTQSATVDPGEAPAILKRARSILLDLKKTGPLSDLGEILAEGIPPDGAPAKHSGKSDAEAAMKEGEAAFARRDFAAARRAYQRALRLDPRLYTAPLFVGDSYFAEGQLPQARAWFARATLVDPDRETAHRYLGDALSKSGKSAEARDKYVDAVIAEPYTRRPWLALAAWARANHVTLGHPQVVPDGLEKGAEEMQEKGAGKPAGADDGRARWPLYEETRAAWSGGRFKSTFPKEPAYRNSLAEEADALRQVGRAVAADVNAGKVKEPHPAFVAILRLDAEGLLEAHVLYARPDEGIAQDYEAYRKAHRGELRRYLTRYVAPLRDQDRDAPPDPRP